MSGPKTSLCLLWCLDAMFKEKKSHSRASILPKIFGIFLGRGISKQIFKIKVDRKF